MDTRVRRRESFVTERAEVMGLPAADVLTPRQMEILQLIADGYATKQAADHLRISIKTYETHRGALQRRLGISTIAGLTRYAIRQGLIEP